MIGSEFQRRYFTTAQKFLRPHELDQLRAARENAGDASELQSGCENLHYAAGIVRSVNGLWPPCRARRLARPSPQRGDSEANEENFQLRLEDTTYARKTLLHPTSGAPAYYIYGVESLQGGRLARDQVVIKSDFSQAFLYRDK